MLSMSIFQRTGFRGLTILVELTFLPGEHGREDRSFSLSGDARVIASVAASLGLIMSSLVAVIESFLAIL